VRDLSILLPTLATSAYAGYSCVDPSDAMARRWPQEEPCKLPMYQPPLPATQNIDQTLRLPAQFLKESAIDGGHAMFWRFPVQGQGPQGAPRHTWR
jgi:hypothetical protein